jgi:tRNA-2-methylthio-N6-dimethylallyladenosine synthase
MKKRQITYIEKPDFNIAKQRINKQTYVVRDDIIVPQTLLDYAQGKKYYIHTYGCQANVRDEEYIKGLLQQAGYQEATSFKEADLLILNTCAVREHAESKVYGKIGTFKSLKQNNPNLIIAIGGCMMQEPHVVETIMNKFTHVDLLFGTHNINQLLDMLNEIYQKPNPIVNVDNKDQYIYENLPSKRNNNFKAYVNIIYGCDKFCTYCIVPFTRGKERSRPYQDIIEECRQLIKRGYQEITLLGQNVNAYSKDVTGGISFAQLLEKVAQLGISRLRFLTSHPWNFTDELIKVMASYDNIMKALHLPIQSGSDAILKRMNRRYTSNEYIDLINKIKLHMPNIALSTDIIVGFPYETEEDFIQTLQVVEKIGFDSCFTFMYSPRLGTPSYKYKNQISKEIKHRRFDELLKIVEKISDEKASAMVNKTYSVLVDGPSKKDPNVLSGYTESGKLVHFKGSRKLVGKIVNVLISESHLYSMIGELVENGN